MRKGDWDGAGCSVGMLYAGNPIIYSTIKLDI